MWVEPSHVALWRAKDCDRVGVPRRTSCLWCDHVRMYCTPMNLIKEWYSSAIANSARDLYFPVGCVLYMHQVRMGVTLWVYRVRSGGNLRTVRTYGRYIYVPTCLHTYSGPVLCQALSLRVPLVYWCLQYTEFVTSIPHHFVHSYAWHTYVHTYIYTYVCTYVKMSVWLRVKLVQCIPAVWVSLGCYSLLDVAVFSVFLVYPHFVCIVFLFRFTHSYVEGEAAG